MTLNRQIVLTSLILAAVILFFGITDVDLWVQDIFYNFSTHKWILDSSLQPYRFIFYDGIKKLLIAIAVLLLLTLLFFYKMRIVQEYKRGMVIVILSAIFVPVIVGTLKKETNMPCPYNEVHYSGIYPRTAVWQEYPKEFTLTHKRSKCWPAGHASGGFALLSLFFLFKKKRNKIIGLGIGFVTGWSMGLYKMIIGDHFLSHTVITMILAWLIILIIAKMISSLHILKL
ncbi:phosphatase PAP2 family protein [Sulfurimonas paralvinellae]|uniref:Phosphatase PAP2 family protein n=1 Tax=Sulfurimonas paralvinellae TaxID=317658 RepID=A0A7M1B756_9BACT|nr:phosphatase PAP2 family protein [Sulfurimonas paralvinellae]QOP45579.1 phosphatase PAP2 family protein [Sulfurimonas paralvinellae]